MIKKISIRLEGGIGDHLCAMRFLPAIQELYPGCEFYGFSDTENNYAAKHVIETLWPGLFKHIEVIPSKKNKNYIMNHQFGKEKYVSLFENIPDEYSYKMLNSFDKFYDLHIDGLHWMKYDFNWSKYFYTFLKPKINLGKKCINKNQIAINLYSDSNPSNLLDPRYMRQLIKELSSQYSLIILATKSNKHIYDEYKNDVTIVIEDIIEVSKIIQNSQLFLTLDSGLKFLGYGLNTPTINFLSQITEYGNLPIHQYIRWNPFIWSVVPLNYDIPKLQNLISLYTTLNNNLLPNIPLHLVDTVLVNRKQQHE